MQPEADPNQVEELATEFAARLRSGEAPAMAEYVSRYPHLQEQIREVFPTVEALERLRQRKVRPRETRAPSGPDRLERLGDLRIVREIGRGGMGVVYEAEQESLGRRVAVKVLPRQSLLDEMHLKRFEREARTAARLHHTNIVPVLGVGECDGYHYYVMQYIDGIGLDRVIVRLKKCGALGAGDLRLSTVLGDDWANRTVAQLPVLQVPSPGRRDADTRDVSQDAETAALDRPESLEVGGGTFLAPTQPLETPLGNGRKQPVAVDQSPVAWTSGARSGDSGGSASRFQRGPRSYWEEIAQIGLQVAGALDYAHQHGILHRDIKPGNLILDAEATVWVADFGLAKAAEHEALSRTGDIVGTLRYMAPEQFRGEADARSDVYSLGVTLYELLALEQCHDESGRKQAILTGELAADPVPLRKRNPAVPRDLETIVMKAAAGEASRRYSTAGMLAEDLRRFLEDRPIAARRARAPERLWRWARRNRAIAALSALAAVLLVLVAVVATAGYVRTTQLLVRESEQRQRTEATLSASLTALDTLYRRFAPDRMLEPSRTTLGEGEDDQVELPAQPVISQETAALLEGMLSIYDALAELDTEDTKLRRDAALASRRVGDIQQRMGQLAQAEKAYQSAIDRYGELLEDSADAGLQAEAARAFNELGNVYRQTRQGIAAFDAHQTALELLRDLAGPGSAAEFRYELAYTNYLMGRRLNPFWGMPPDGSPGVRDGESREPFERRFGRRFRDRFRIDDTDGPRSRESAGGRDDESRGGHPPAGERDRSTPGGRPDVEHPQAPGLAERPLHEDEGRPPRPLMHGPGRESEWNRRYLDEAIRLLTELRSEAPTVPEYSRLLALCYRDRSQPGNEDFEQAVGILEDLVSEYPEVAEFRFDLCETLAAVKPRRMSPEDGREVERRLREALRYARTLDMNVPAFLDSRVRVSMRLGYLLLHSGRRGNEGEAANRRGEAEQYFREAVEVQSRLVSLVNGSPPMLIRLAHLRHALAELLRRGESEQDLDEVIALLTAAREALRGLAEDANRGLSVGGKLSEIDAALSHARRMRGQRGTAGDRMERIEQFRKRVPPGADVREPEDGDPQADM